MRLKETKEKLQDLIDRAFAPDTELDLTFENRVGMIGESIDWEAFLSVANEDVEHVTVCITPNLDKVQLKSTSPLD